MVSVVVCTYNREKFLPDCLRSLAAQQAAPATFEVLIVNNQSTDGTDDIARSFLRDHPHMQIRYMVEKKKGLSHARNRGLSESLGEVVTYIDDDAIATPGFVGHVQRFFAEHPDAAAVGGKVLARFEGPRPEWFNRYSASLFFSHYDPGDQPFRYGASEYPIGCNMSIRRTILQQAGGFDPKLGRKGKGGVGAEEKALFRYLHQEELPCYFDPSQVVYHQIDKERTEPAYTRKLALGLGQTHRLMYCSKGLTWSCLGILLMSLLKFEGALALALGYWIRGKGAVARHLVWYRWMVLKGLLTNSG